MNISFSFFYRKRCPNVLTSICQRLCKDPTGSTVVQPGSIEETESQSRGDENGRQTPPTSTSEPNSAGEKGTQDEEKLKDQQTRNIEPVKRY